MIIKQLAAGLHSDCSTFLKRFCKTLYENGQVNSMKFETEVQATLRSTRNKEFLKIEQGLVSYKTTCFIQM